jgi:hypothetical protein
LCECKSLTVGVLLFSIFGSPFISKWIFILQKFSAQNFILLPNNSYLLYLEIIYRI